MRRGELKVFLLHHLGQSLVWNGCFLCGSTICWLGVPSLWGEGWIWGEHQPCLSSGCAGLYDRGCGWCWISWHSQQRERLPAETEASLSRGRVCCLVAGVETLRIWLRLTVPLKCMRFSFSHTGTFALKEGKVQVSGAPVLYRGPALCLCRRLQFYSAAVQVLSFPLLRLAQI